MEHADFVHLVRLSEHASADNSARYRRGVAAFATLGYLWVLGCLALALALFAGLAHAVAQGSRMSFVHFWIGVFALGLLWATLRALWVRHETPRGVPLRREDAPGLFEALDRIRERIAGPPVHRVYLDDEFNASIRQRPRFGLFGGAVNTLSIGLPLLMALDRSRVLSVLAHEYGHLRGNHGRLSAWIYRSRMSWLRLDASLKRDQGLLALVSQAFFHWYCPRFAARTFALARQDEYEADRISARLLGTTVAASALIEIAIKDAWCAEVFWPRHWARASGAERAVGPFSAMRVQFRVPPEASFTRAALRSAMRRIKRCRRTPTRCCAIASRPCDRRAQLPVWSARSAMRLLADGGKAWIGHFDRQWCREHAADWRAHHVYLTRVRERVHTLAESAQRNNADEMVEWADLERRLDPDAPVRARYERALELAPDHAGALRGLVQMQPATERAQRLKLLDRLHGSGADNRWAAARTAVAALEDPDAGAHDEPALKLWRDRLKDAEEAESRAWAEITATSFFNQIAPHDLGDFEAGELRADLLRCPAVSRAWLVRKSLREFPWRRAYILFIELPGLTDEERYPLCRQLEQTLSLPGMALVLWAGRSPTRAEIERHVAQPFWVRFGR